MNWILPEHLAIGDFIDAEDAEKAGIRSVLSLAVEHEPVHPNTVHIALNDGPNSPELIAHAIRTLDRLLRASSPVLVHCHAGLSRSPSIVAGYLATYAGHSLQDAFVFVDERRRIQISPGLIPSLRTAVSLLLREASRQ